MTEQVMQQQQQQQQQQQHMSNPWGATTDTNNYVKVDDPLTEHSSNTNRGNTTTTTTTTRTTSASITSLQTIMKEQHHQQQQDELNNELLTSEDEEMRLAVEASLLYEINNSAKTSATNQENVTNSAATATTTTTSEEDDFNRALKLSMDDSVKISSSTTTTTTTTIKTEEKDEKEMELALQDDPKYTNYFLMKNVMNVDVPSIKKAMKIDGFDESILDLDPNKSLKEQQKQKEDDKASYEIALQLQREEDEYFAMAQVQQKLKLQQQGMKLSDGLNSSVRTVTRDEFERQKQAQNECQSYESTPKVKLGEDDNDHEILENDYYSDDDEEILKRDSGFRMNSNTISSNQSTTNPSSWNRSKSSSHTIIGPNGEIRTKHDVDLKHLSNAQRLLANEDDLDSKYNAATINSRVSDNAYNSFHQKLKRHTNKGVAAHAHGKSEAYGDKTRGGAMDASTRLILQKAINNNIIKKVNGVVSEGKEAVVYHADDNVAVKIFKRIQEFRNRGEYVDGDVRYYQKSFGKVGKRQQLELWAEKEYKNLIRVNRACIPAPTPILQKQNVLLMKFLGEDSWPAPKLRDIELKHGSSKWIHFYCQVLVYIKKLYHCANLIHADLSEYNVLIVPSSQVQCHQSHNKDGSGITANQTNPQEEDVLQVAFIDFGQSVDATSHPKADEYLRRDVSTIQTFFEKVGGISVLSLEEVLSFIMYLKVDDEENVVTKEGEDEEEDWELTTSTSDDKDKQCDQKSKVVEGEEVDEEKTNDYILKEHKEFVGEEGDEYILISKEKLPSTTTRNEIEKQEETEFKYKGCYKKLNFWNDENEYECILKQVVIT